MPVLKDFRLTKKIILPSYEDSEVEIYNSLLASETDGLTELEKEPSVKKLLDILPKFIKKWNFVDEQKNILPINPNSLDFLGEKDLMFIIEQVKEFATSVKKN